MMGQTIHHYHGSAAVRPAEIISSPDKTAGGVETGGEAALRAARRFPSNQRDAAWKAAKLYEDKLKDKTRARDVCATVPASSSHYGDAQKTLR